MTVPCSSPVCIIPLYREMRFFFFFFYLSVLSSAALFFLKFTFCSYHHATISRNRSKIQFSNDNFSLFFLQIGRVSLSRYGHLCRWFSYLSRHKLNLGMLSLVAYLAGYVERVDKNVNPYLNAITNHFPCTKFNWTTTNTERGAFSSSSSCNEAESGKKIDDEKSAEIPFWCIDSDRFLCVIDKPSAFFRDGAA